MAAGNITIPDSLLAEIQNAAEAEHRSVEDVLTDAVKKYLEDRSWEKLFRCGRERAEAEGITSEEGIDQVISDWRKENPQHGRS